MLQSPLCEPAYGVTFALLGYLILAFAADKPISFTATVSGFLLVGPLAAAGLYEISRRRSEGRSCSLLESLQDRPSQGASSSTSA